MNVQLSHSQYSKIKIQSLHNQPKNEGFADLMIRKVNIGRDNDTLGYIFFVCFYTCYMSNWLCLMGFFHVWYFFVFQIFTPWKKYQQRSVH